MISVSAHWLDPKQKPTFLSIPEIAPLVGRVEAAHLNLVSAREGITNDTALRVAIDLADLLDNRHDHRLRALYYLLLAAQHFELGKDPPDETRADEIDRASEKLFPTQLQAVIASYQAEAGNAAQLAELAKGPLAGVLASILLSKDASALDLAAGIGEVGKALGEAEAKKAAAAAAVHQSLTPAEIRIRMRAWAALAETILSNLAQSDAPAAAIDAIRAPLLAAAEKATARRRERQAVKTKGKEGEGSTDGG